MERGGGGNRFRRYRLSIENKDVRQKSPVWSLLYRDGDEHEIWIETTRLTAIFNTTAAEHLAEIIKLS